MNGGRTKRGRMPRLATALFFLLFLLSGPALGGDIVRLKNGRSVEGKIVSLTPSVVTIQLEYGVLRVPRTQVVSIQMERKPLVLPPAPPASEGAASEEIRPPREPEPGEEGWKGPAVQSPASGKKVEAGKAASPARGKKPVDSSPGKGKEPGKESAPRSSSSPAQAPLTGGDEVVDYLLKRYVWLIPNSTGNRITLGVGILFVLAMASYISARLADIEDITLSRAFVFTVAALLVFLGEAALSWHASWPILAGLGGLDLFLWFAGVRVFLGEGAWKGFLMLAFFSFALLVCVLWLEIGGYILSL